MPDADLDRLIDAIAARDHDATLSAFSTEHDPAVVGSEPGETAIGRAEVEGFVSRLDARPGAFRFSFPKRTWAARGDVAWVFAEGTVIQPLATMAKPYRLTGVFVLEDSAWKMVLWSGAEPSRSASMPARPELRG